MVQVTKVLFVTALIAGIFAVMATSMISRQVYAQRAQHLPSEKTAIIITFDEDFNNLSTGIDNAVDHVPLIPIPGQTHSPHH